jgi:hypothetical protein
LNHASRKVVHEHPDLLSEVGGVFLHFLDFLDDFDHLDSSSIELFAVDWLVEQRFVELPATDQVLLDEFSDLVFDLLCLKDLDFVAADSLHWVDPHQLPLDIVSVAVQKLEDLVFWRQTVNQVFV